MWSAQPTRRMCYAIKADDDDDKRWNEFILFFIICSLTMCHGVLAFVFNSCTFTLSKCEMNEWGENNDKKATKNYVSSIRHSKNSPLVWLLFFCCQDIHDTFLPTAFSFSLFAADVCATTWRIHSFFAYKHPFQQQEKKKKKEKEIKRKKMFIWIPHLS